MIRIKILIFALLFALLGSPLTAIASNISNALYFGTIVISNNSTATTNVATVANISTTNLISGGYLNATANNTVMRNSSGADVPFMPGYTPSSAFWCMFVPSMGADSYLTYLLYTDNSFNGEIRYFPGAAGMVTADNASLELGDNFSIIQSGFINTTAGAGKYLTDKPAAIRVAISDTVSGTIDVSVSDNDCLDYVRANNDWTRVPDDNAFSFTDGAGNDEPFTFIAWVNLDDATNSSIIVKRNDAAVQSEWQFHSDGGDLLTIRLLAPNAANDIDAQSVAITGDEGTWHHYAATYDGTEVNTGLELFRDGINATNARGGGGVYVGMTNGTEVVNIGSRTAGGANYLDGQMAEIKVYAAELTPAEIFADFEGGHKATDLVAWWKIDEGVGLPQDSSGNGHHANQNLADWVNTFTQRFVAFLTAVGITSDEYVIEVSGDSVNMSLIIDGTIEDEQALGGLSIPDTGGNWSLVRAAAMPYMEYHRITIDGTLQQDIVWEYDTVFHDTSYYGVEFDGNGDYISVPYDLTLEPATNDFSISFWMYLDSLKFARTIGKSNYAGFPSTGWQVFQNVGSMVFQLGDGVAEVNPSLAGFVIEKWYFVAAVRDSGNTVTIYNITDGTSTSVADTTGDITLNNSFYIGGRIGAAGETIDGILDEITYYNRALSLVELTTNYNVGVGSYVPDDTTDLDGWWHLEEGTGIAAADSSGNGNNGVLTNGPRWVNGHVPLPFGTSGTNDATPSFRTASSDVDVIGNMTAFTPISQAQAPAYALGPVNPFISSTPNITGVFTVVPPPGTFPLAGVISTIANATGTPAQLPLTIIACFIILAASLTTSYTMRKYGSGTLIIKGFVIIGLMGIFIALGDFAIDWWMLIIFAILATGIAMASRQSQWQ